MAKWKTSPLAAVCTFFGDGDWIESKDQSPEGVRLVQTGNVGEGEFKDRAEKARFISQETFTRLRCTEIFAGDCLISRLPDPVGRACLIAETGERMITAVDCTIVRFDQSKLLPEFFAYYSQAGDYLVAVEREATGTTRKRISRARLGQISVPVPPLPEQRRIVAVLGEAFECIATAKANAEQNVQNARELFQGHLAQTFSQTRSGWVKLPLGRVTSKIGSGATPLGGEDAYKEEGISLVRSLNVYDDGFRFAKLAHLDDDQAARLSNVEVQPQDVLLNITGASVARCCVVPTEVLPARVNQHVSIIRPIKTVLDAEFLHYLLISQPSKERLLGIGAEGGSTRQAITKAQIQDFVVEFPSSIYEQRSIVGAIDEIKLATEGLEAVFARKLAVLDELKKSLLHQAFAGTLTTKTTDQQVAEVA